MQNTSPPLSPQPSSSSPQQPSKRKHTKNAKRLAGVGSFLGAVAAIVAILQFFNWHPFPVSGPPPISNPSPTSIPTPTPTPTPISSPTPTPIHLVACYAASGDTGALKVFLQGGAVVCFYGVGTISHTVQPVVRVETGTTFATWQYITISTGIAHHSPQNNSYNCPSDVALYSGEYMMRITQITIVSNSTSCYSHKGGPL